MLPEEQARVYYCTTEQLLFLSRVCCEIQTTVAYLTTRVKQPNEDDWGKLKHVLKYFNSTRLLHLTLLLSPSQITTGMWMLLTKHMTTVRGTQAVFLRLEKMPPQVLPTNRRYPPKAHPKEKLFPNMTNQVMYSGHTNISKLKNMLLPPMSCFKTT
jgi:hypothetical protein